MEILAPVLAPLAAATRSAGRSLVQLANPQLASSAAYEARACAGYPLIELDHAMVAVAGYAALVAYGLATRPAARAAGAAETEKAADKKKAAAAAAAPPATAAAAAAAPAKKGGFSAAGALRELRKEPLKVLMLLYNAAQVLLCGYMMLEALRVAVAHYARPVCNAHVNTRSSELKDVLWLFYVSKVLDFADTFFIVVRGKWEQFSFLHVYHHFSSEQEEGKTEGARAGGKSSSGGNVRERAEGVVVRVCGS